MHDANAVPLRVLAVDDDVDDTAAMRRLLELLGCEVRTCNEAHRCVELAREFQPRLVMLDVGMPGISGLEIAAELLAAGLPPFLLVARTGFADDETKAACVEAGFNLVVVKPTHPKKLDKILSAARQLALA